MKYNSSIHRSQKGQKRTLSWLHVDDKPVGGRTNRAVEHPTAVAKGAVNGLGVVVSGSGGVRAFPRTLRPKPVSEMTTNSLRPLLRDTISPENKHVKHLSYEPANGAPRPQR